MSGSAATTRHSGIDSAVTPNHFVVGSTRSERAAGVRRDEAPLVGGLAVSLSVARVWNGYEEAFAQALNIVTWSTALS